MEAPHRTSIPIIDLTGDDTPPGGASLADSGRVDVTGPVGEEPPQKRQKVSGENEETINQVWDCIRTQVGPHITAATRRLAVAAVDQQQLFSDVLHSLTKAEFPEEVRRGNGKLSAEYEAQLASRAEQEVKKRAGLLKYRVQQPPREAVQNGPANSSPGLQTQQPVAPASVAHLRALRPSQAPPRPSGGPARTSHQAFIQPRPRTTQDLPPDPRSRAVPTPPTANRAPPPGRPSNPRGPRAELESDERDLVVLEDDTDSAREIEPAQDPPSTTRSRITRLRTPPPSGKNRKVVATSPQNFRSRAQAQSLRTQDHSTLRLAGTATKETYFSLPLRPYRRAEDRDAVVRGGQKLLKMGSKDLKEPHTFHVDISPHEARHIHETAMAILAPAEAGGQSSGKDIGKLLKKKPHLIPTIADRVDLQKLQGRVRGDIVNYLTDLSQRVASREPPSFLRIARDDFDKHGRASRESRLNALLLAREMTGPRGFGSMGSHLDISNELKKCIEDGIELRTEWTNCAGDISTIVWASDHAFICGTTAHSDSRNQQYNKPGNLLLGSAQLETLKAYPDHRIARPIVRDGDNATDAMIQSQDPWLYTSVVSSDYDAAHGRAFTSGFDKTVKIWEVERLGSSMKAVGTWLHDGNVNFVVASSHTSRDHGGMIATAADVPLNAVRVYKVQKNNISGSAYQSYSCSRVVDHEGNPVQMDKWSYFPATIRWGIVKEVKSLFLVGYSPRSLTGDDKDIPEDRQNSGEICLWDGLTGKRWKITGGTVQNVFEVAWHPTQPWFIVATSPVGMNADDHVYTQIRIFKPSDNKDYGGQAFGEIQVLDCPAMDINELTIRPNSAMHSYITAGCTDGKTYVWDTARGDKPIHVLRHGALVEEEAGDVISVEDTGVKFTAWGSTPDRFYTGSSDGVVKVWNIRSATKPLIRDLLECPAPVSFGAFSRDFTRLIIGDASGRVFLLCLDGEDEFDAPVRPPRFTEVKLPDGTTRKIRRPNPFTPHAEPDPPTHDAESNPIPREETGITRAKDYVESGQLRIHPDPTVGAVKGPKYPETNLYRREAHYKADPAQPLLARIEEGQQENRKMFPDTSGKLLPLRDVKKTVEEEALHLQNLSLDLDVESLSPNTLRDLRMAGADLDPSEPDYGFEYEEMPDI